jgi:hypothetical protein
VSALKQSGTPQVLVATSDSDLRDSISGAHVVTCAALLREITNVSEPLLMHPSHAEHHGFIFGVARKAQHRYNDNCMQAEKEAAERIRVLQLTPWQERPGIGASVLSQNPGLYKKLNDMRAGRF